MEVVNPTSTPISPDLNMQIKINEHNKSNWIEQNNEKQQFTF